MEEKTPKNKEFIGYEFFQSNMDFYEFQKANPEVVIVSVVPVNGAINFHEVKTDSCDFKVNGKIGSQVFVTYHYINETKEEK